MKNTAQLEGASCSKTRSRKRIGNSNVKITDDSGQSTKRKRNKEKTICSNYFATGCNTDGDKAKTECSPSEDLLCKDDRKSTFTKLRPSQSWFTSNANYTPLEQQYLDLKRNHQDSILLVECGYKYRCFDKDAEVVSQELNMGCFPDRNFVSTSFPTHRVYVHLRRLVAKGHKVGLVKQVETTALKAAGDNRSKIFDRELTAIYTKSTLVEYDAPICDDNKDVMTCNEIVKNNSGYLVCVYEVPTKSEKQTDIGVLAVRPTTGDIGYWCFVDDLSRVKLESIMNQLQPVEILAPLLSLSQETEQLIKYVIDSFCTIDDRIHLERMEDDKFLFTHALSKLSDFYTSRENSNHDAYKTYVLSLPPVIICCLGALLEYLQELKLEEILRNPCYIKEIYGFPDVMFLSASTHGVCEK